MRVGEKSAEAIVVRRPGESPAERRAEGRGVELDRKFQEILRGGLKRQGATVAVVTRPAKVGQKGEARRARPSETASGVPSTTEDRK